MTETLKDPLQIEPQHSVFALGLFPGFSPEAFESIADQYGQDALILIGDAGGGVSHAYHPAIARLSEAGSAIFVVREAATPGSDYNNYGKVHLTDQPLVDAIAAGAVNLDKANTTNVPEVMTTVIEGLDKGLHGKELQAAVLSQFSLRPEEKPVSAYEHSQQPEYWIAYDERLHKEGLGGLPEGALDRALAELSAKE